MYNEHFEFKLVRTYGDGTEEEIVTTKDGETVRHHELGVMFNRFLTSCGYVGHRYENQGFGKYA